MNNIANWLPDKVYSSNTLVELINNERAVSNVTNLWQQRPSRITSITKEELQKFEESYNDEYEYECNRLSDVLKINFYNDKKLLELFSENKLAQKCISTQNYHISSGIYFPNINEKHEETSYISTLSTFCLKVDYEKYKNQDTESISQGKLKTSELKLAKLLANNNFKYIPELFIYLSPSQQKGNSYELAWFLKEYLKDSQSKDISRNKSFFCTGEIDSSGNINKIEYAIEKMNTAIHFSFDYIFFPKANEKELENFIKKTGTRQKILFFNNIEELKIELLNIQYNLKNRDIPRWLATNQKTPSHSEFIKYFKKQESYSPINKWKSKIQSTSLDDKISKLETIINEYANYIINLKQLSNFCKHLPSITPNDYFYYAIPELLKANKKNIIELEKFYYSLSDKLVSNDNNTILASHRLSKVAIYRNPTIEAFIKQYPAFMGMFFNNPSELLYLISCFSDTNYKKYQNLLQIVIKKCSNPQKNSETEIMTAILHELSESKHIRKIMPNEISDNSELAKLVIAKRLIGKKNRPMLESACNLYFKFKISSFTNRQYLSLLKDTYDKVNTACDTESNPASPAKLAMQLPSENYNIYQRALKQRKFPSPKDYNQELLSLKNNCINTLLQLQNTNTQKKPKLILPGNVFPQPAFNLLANIMNIFSFQNLRDVFKDIKSINKITQTCLVYWYGIQSAHTNGNPMPNKYIYYPAFYIGYLKGLSEKLNKCELMNYTDKLEKDIEKYHNKDAFFQFIWLKFLPSDIFNIIRETLQNKLYSISNNLGNNAPIEIESRILKTVLFGEMVDFDALPPTLTQKLWQPIYRFLVKNEYNDNSFNSHGSYNGQFACEFIKVFCKSDHPESQLFCPIHWRCSIDKQMFNTIAISYLKNNKYLLKNYLFEYVDDLPNLLLGFRYIKTTF